MSLHNLVYRCQVNRRCKFNPFYFVSIAMNSDKDRFYVELRRRELCRQENDAS